MVSSEADHFGWLVTIIDRQTGESDYEHEAWVLNAGAVSDAPVARIAIPHGLRPQVHGWWVSKAQLEAARS
ncbi:carotenoid oxygenase family protein [Hyphococcus luteus]|uniref:carotenoid oxygenase family protein n=1 Tax=Hyphococcus luteus TaxID=2058213 RepID=UPI00243444C4|nr:carotenoid oxygenase family protein [Marinicaulis flavus]